MTLGALRWIMDQAYRPNDTVHVVHVVKCLVQKLEVYHGTLLVGACKCSEYPCILSLPCSMVYVCWLALNRMHLPVARCRGARHIILI